MNALRAVPPGGTLKFSDWYNKIFLTRNETLAPQVKAKPLDIASAASGYVRLVLWVFFHSILLFKKSKHMRFVWHRHG